MSIDTAHESPELVALFRVYTAGDDTIGHDLAAVKSRATSGGPLLVATSADLILYPGGGGPPRTFGFRFSPRGFKELAGVSHLGPALATLVALKQAGAEDRWRAGADRLTNACRAARKANSTELWRDRIAAEAFRGREAAIANMIDYALAVTDRYLGRALADDDELSFETLRATYLNGQDRDDLLVPFDRIMIATFFLTGLDIAHRLINWLDQQQLDWASTMVVIAGQQGRPTAGVTIRTNSVVGMIRAAGRGALRVDRVYIAPHANAPEVPVDGDLAPLIAKETELRELWAGTRAIVELGADMFPDQPSYRVDDGDGDGGSVDAHTDAVSEMPAIAGPDDWASMITRLRMVMEDPRQLLSGAVTDFAASQLIDSDNDPTAVTVPGLDGEPYPRRQPS